MTKKTWAKSRVRNFLSYQNSWNVYEKNPQHAQKVSERFWPSYGEGRQQTTFARDCKVLLAKSTGRRPGPRKAKYEDSARTRWALCGMLRPLAVLWSSFQGHLSPGFQYKYGSSSYFILFFHVLFCKVTQVDLKFAAHLNQQLQEHGEHFHQHGAQLLSAVAQSPVRRTWPPKTNSCATSQKIRPSIQKSSPISPSIYCSYQQLMQTPKGSALANWFQLKGGGLAVLDLPPGLGQSSARCHKWPRSCGARDARPASVDLSILMHVDELIDLDVKIRFILTRFSPSGKHQVQKNQFISQVHQPKQKKTDLIKGWMPHLQQQRESRNNAQDQLGLTALSGHFLSPKLVTCFLEQQKRNVSCDEKYWKL